MMGFKLCFALFFPCSLLFGPAIAEDGKVHIVYMGSLLHNNIEALVTSHLEVLSSVLESPRHAKQSLLRSYTYAFNGFAAELSKEQATALVGKPGVLSVFPNQVLNLHTTHSWEYLEKVLAMPGTSNIKPESSGADVIIGFLDTGIWPEAASFSDKGMGSVPSRWKGACVKGEEFNVSNCNRKIIGARYYSGGEDDDFKKNSKPETRTARDYEGHGTHTSSTAAGSFVDNANYNGLAMGTARGGPASSSTRIAMYRVCGLEYWCPSVQLLAAFDDAVKDGVDILSVSIGVRSSFQEDFMKDAIAIGAFHATQKGILVVCSAGNEGPDSQTVVNVAPWIFTVGATTIDREYLSNVVLGNGKIIKGKSILFSNISISHSAVYPLVYAGSIPDKSSDPLSARACLLDSLDARKAKGKFVVCISNDTAVSTWIHQLTVQNAGGIGMVLVDDLEMFDANDFGTFPATTVSKTSATEIISYIKSTRNPVVTITPTEVVTNYKPAPVVADFSSRGPGALTQNILKPDISAPGVNIIAAWNPPGDFSDISDTVHLSEMMPSTFNIMSGTSMATPHISGAAAFVKSMNPTWSSSAIRSAIITTAIVTNNMGKQLTNDSDIPGTPFDFGAGVVNPMGALQPGLVYETTIDDYFHFLCNYGLDSEKIKLIAGNKSYKCPSGAKVDLISDMNYPSIAISKLDIVNGSTTIRRTVTNLSPDVAPTYKATIDAPPGLNVKVSPQILHFSKTSYKLSFDVGFTPTNVATKGYAFGTLVWTDGKHNVRTPFAVNMV